LKVNLFSLALGVPEPFETRYDPAGLELNTQDVELIEPLTLKGELEKVDGALSVTGTLNSRIRETCARCLARTERPYKLDLQLTLEISGEEGERDFTPELREEVLLSYPVPFLCSENCKGLCPGCGANLNVTACDCRPDAKEKSPFDVLKKIKKTEKDGK